MRGTSHQGARCYQRIRSQFLTSSRVNTHGRSPECGRRSKARRPRSGTAYVTTCTAPRAVSRCSWLSTERPRRRPRIELSSFSILLIFSQPSNHVRHPPATPANPDRSRGDGRQAATHDRPRPPDKPRCTCSPLTRPSCDAHIICLTFHSSVPLNREPIVLAAAREATCLRPCFGLSVTIRQLPVCSRLSETDSLAL